MARRIWSRWPVPLVLALVALAALWRSPPETLETGSVQTVEDTPRLVALTFDDGPRAGTTARLLDGLEQRGVRATFFLIGKQLPGNEDLIRRMAQSGHQLGIHTYDHVSLAGLGQGDFDAQVAATRQALTALTDQDSFLLRPPYGAVDEGVLRMAGAPIVLWSVDPEDWHQRDVRREVDHILTHVSDGDIILFHDIYAESVSAALEVVDRLHQAGYALVTVEELFAARGVELQPGEVYRCCPPP